MDQDLKDLEAREDRGVEISHPPVEIVTGSQYANDFAQHLFKMAVSMNRAAAAQINNKE